ncbi:hypothetical protein ACFX11_032216 [Malus domestica]
MRPRENLPFDMTEKKVSRLEMGFKKAVFIVDRTRLRLHIPITRKDSDKVEDAEIQKCFQSLPRGLASGLLLPPIFNLQTNHKRRLRSPPARTSASPHLRSPLSCGKERTASYQVRRERHPLDTCPARPLRHCPLVLFQSRMKDTKIDEKIVWRSSFPLNMEELKLKKRFMNHFRALSYSRIALLSNLM